jgi:hypothetical protein
MKQTVIRMAGIAMLLATVLMLNGIVSGELSLWLLPLLPMCGLATAGVLMAGIQTAPRKRCRASARATRPRVAQRPAGPTLAIYRNQSRSPLRVRAPIRHTPFIGNGNYDNAG